MLKNAYVVRKLTLMKMLIKTIVLLLFSLLFLAAMAACQSDTETVEAGEQEAETASVTIAASLADGLHGEWDKGDNIMLMLNGNTAVSENQGDGTFSIPSEMVDNVFSDNASLYGIFPAEAQATSVGGELAVNVQPEQVAGENGYDEASAVSVARAQSGTMSFRTICGGIRLNFQMSGVTKVVLESVDGYALAGKAKVGWDENGVPLVAEVSDSASIITFSAPDESGFTPSTDYYISTLPCDVYGGYRLTVYKDGMAANYFGVHQTVERAIYISPSDLVEGDLEFDDPDAPLVEEERPELDATTSALLRQYKQSSTEENKQALLEQMGLRYDKVVARKKAKLRELEREAKTPDLVEEMQAIVDEMVENREIRLEQQFLRLIDPRSDDDADDQWEVLRGSSAPNAYIAYAPVTNAEYAAFKEGFSFKKGQENYPVVNVTVAEAEAYCQWLASQDKKHAYRLPTDEEWILAAGHMPKDVSMNAGRVESGLTAVDAYAQTTGACGGIDFWGNCWEWTSTTDNSGLYIIKGGSWDSDRDDCRSEKSDVVRNGAQGYANVGFRVVRTDH